MSGKVTPEELLRRLSDIADDLPRYPTPQQMANFSVKIGAVLADTLIILRDHVNQPFTRAHDREPKP